jgi:alpha-methylacyl-CoA racemase
MQRPLEGNRVLDLSRLLPGPYLTLILADLGADVVKVEDPRLGDYMRAAPPLRDGLGARFLAMNRDKRSLGLDLKAAAGREAFLRLAAGADVVLESFRPGVIDRLGVGFAALSARNPRLVLCSISGYGQDGPYRDRAGHDLNYIGLGGVLAMTGARGGPPVMPGVQIADIAGGALWGAVAILGALVGRTVTGKGAHLDISMTEGAMALLAAEQGNAAMGARPTRGTESLNGGLACYGVYRTRDGKHMTLGALEPKFWLAFNQAIGRTGDMGELAAPPAEQERIRGEVQTIVATRTRDEWVAFLADKDVLCEPMLEPEELRAHALHAARRMFFELDGVTLMRTPVGPPVARRRAPRLGQHSDEVLAENGFSAEEIAALRRAGAIT